MNPLSAIALRQGDIEAAERLVVDTAAIAADTGWEATALVNLAEVLMAKGETAAAAATLRRAVTRALDSGLENWFRIALRDLATLAVQGGQPGRAARLMGASRSNMPHYGLDPGIYQSIESGCRAVLDEETVAREVAAGERMEHAEIVQFALE